MSHAARTHSNNVTMHTGMGKKPLVPYHPDSYRSRLPSSDFIVPYKNTSQVEIGDRSSYNPKSQFRTTNMALMNPPNMTDMTSNGGVIAERTKWTRKRAED
mmetsp:Transcript_7831/g.1020  ORF Transcript_7831/g.1020 Transcript_7831/m.1020 type:complete len:101 (-) Transcript_7831:32-334(-)